MTYQWAFLFVLITAITWAITVELVMLNSYSYINYQRLKKLGLINVFLLNVLFVVK